ncbi:MAG: M48 family metalloprotease, partial [Steroidobacteraceae bacterium]
MRALLRPALLTLLSATTVVATLASAAQPPATVDLSAPAAGSDLPDLGSPSAALLSRTDEYRLGAMVAHQLREQNGLLEDPEVNEYVESLGLRLASQSPDGGAGFQYLVVKDPEINSFAVSGGWVFMYTGLILATRSESELAAVMAHETAHITQHHIARALRAQSQQSLTTAAALIAAILLGSLGGGGQATEGAIVAAQG